MTDDDFDDVLGREDHIVPSSGFVAGVMDVVRREASAPPPIPFPWKRALPGVALAALALFAVLALAVNEFLRGAASTYQVPPALMTIVKEGNQLGMGWVALALLLSFAAVRVSMRLAGGRT